jgi:hypothetical protein
MNSKLVKASLAGAAVVALAAGGGTFAAWSDFSNQATGAGAGYLRLGVNGQDGTAPTVQPFNLAPGTNKTQTFWFTSADKYNTTHGKLTAYIQGLTDTEDTGAGTCTTASEAVAEGTPNCAANGGELSSEATIFVARALSITSQAACDHYTATAPNILVSNVVMNTAPNSAAAPIDVADDLAPGDGACMFVEVSLPSTADNTVQGDDMSWTWHFDLTQI